MLSIPFICTSFLVLSLITKTNYVWQRGSPSIREFREGLLPKNGSILSLVCAPEMILFTFLFHIVWHSLTNPAGCLVSSHLQHCASRVAVLRNITIGKGDVDPWSFLWGITLLRIAGCMLSLVRILLLGHWSFQTFRQLFTGYSWTLPDSHLFLLSPGWFFHAPDEYYTWCVFMVIDRKAVTTCKSHSGGDTSRSLCPCDGKRVWDACSWGR